MSAAGLPPVAQPVSGTWSVQAIDGERFTLTIGVGGQRPITAVLGVVEQQTVFNETESLTVQRIR